MSKWSVGFWLAVASSLAVTVVLSVLVWNRDVTAEQAATFNFAIRVRDETGAPIGTARFVSTSGTDVAADDGTIILTDVQEAVAGHVEAPGFLSAPLVVGLGDAFHTLDVRLWAEREGRRFSYNAAGDFMLGTRHGLDGEPSSAEEAATFERIGLVFGAATLSSVNLSSVVTDLPSNAAAPGKTFTFAMSPASSDVLLELGVDFVTLANDNARDYEERGIADTLANLAEREILSVGAGVTPPQAATSLSLRPGRNRLGVLSYSLVGADYFNDALPGRSETSDDLPAWQRELRRWGFTLGETEVVPELPRTAGESWRAFLALERELPEKTDQAWASLLGVFPELQHWSAERGGGGANPWRAGESPQEIAQASADNTAVIVHLHGGSLWQQVPTDEMRSAARAAVDAGADLVIAHHPHVVQGVEAYKDALIFYSLGNFAFDHGNSLAYSSGFLHTVWERDELLEARFVPMLLTSQGPQFVADAAADTIVRELELRSVMPATARSVSGRTIERNAELFVDKSIRVVRPVFESPDRLLPSFRYERNSILVAPDGFGTEDANTRPEPGEPPATPRPGDTVQLDGHPIIHWGANTDPRALQLGIERNLDPSFDARQVGPYLPSQWDLGPASSIRSGGGTHGRFLQIRRTSASDESAIATLRSPIAVGDNDLFDAAGTAVSPSSAFELQLRSRLSGEAKPEARVRYFTVDPRTANLTSQRDLMWTDTHPIDVPSDGNWHRTTIRLDVPDDAAEFEIEVLLDPEAGVGELAVDEFRVIEWRAPGGPLIPLPADYLRLDEQAPHIRH